MTIKRVVLNLAIFLCLLQVNVITAQCSGCSIVVADNSISSYTVSTGQTLCVVGNFTYTGTILLNGGTVCNAGTIKKITFKSGIFNNTLNAKISATLHADMQFSLNGKTVINNYSGSQIAVNDSINFNGNSTDSLIFNVHKGSSVNCGKLRLNSSIARFNIGLAATTTSNSAFITSFNINGAAKFESHLHVSVNELSSFNVNGDLFFQNAGIKTITNYGVVNVNNNFTILGDANYTGTVTINNYGELTVLETLSTTLIEANVSINNYPRLPASIMYVAESININQASTQLNNEDILEVGETVNIVTGSFNNRSYLEAADVVNEYGTINNYSVITVSRDFRINQSDANLTNNGSITVDDEFKNNGKVNLGKRSIINTNHFDNVVSTSSVIGSPNILNESSVSDNSTYPRIYVKNTSRNAGVLSNYILFVDFTYTLASTKKIDEQTATSNIQDQVIFVQPCNFFIPIGYFTARRNNSSKRNHVGFTFCPGESITLIFNPLMPIVSGPFWTYTLGATTSSASGMILPITNLPSGGMVTVSGTYSYGTTNCSFSMQQPITIGNGSIITTSPIYFGNGNNVTLNSTVTVGAAPYQFTWTPNYFFVSPSTRYDEDPIVNPQVSLIYTVNVRDGYGCTATTSLEVIAEPFASLDKELSGEYYKLVNNQLFFKHEGQYDNSSLIYNLYDKSNALVASNTSNNVVNSLNIKPGDNRLTLNATSLSAGFYILEVINEKKEKTYLRFVK